MITLLASIAGFLISAMPEIFKFIKDKSDKQHHLSILDRQFEHGKLLDFKMKKDTNYSIEQLALYSTYRTGITWVDTLNGTVRPVLAYSFFLLYAAVKIIQYKTLSSIFDIDILWSVDDKAIFAGVISFYFGQRTFGKIWKNRHT